MSYMHLRVLESVIVSRWHLVWIYHSPLLSSYPCLTLIYLTSTDSVHPPKSGTSSYVWGVLNYAHDLRPIQVFSSHSSYLSLHPQSHIDSRNATPSSYTDGSAGCRKLFEDPDIPSTFRDFCADNEVRK